MEQYTGSKLGKEYVKAVYCHAANLTYAKYIYIYIYIYSEYIIQNAGLYKSQAGRLPGEISITSDMQVTPLLWQKVKRN